MDEPSIDLLERYRQGDDQAATELFRRYVSRLTVLARARMAPKIARRFDPEDVVLSAYRTFFVRARNGQFTLNRSGDLWRLLVGIVQKKLYHQTAEHTAAKRSVDREIPLPAGGDSAWQFLPVASRYPRAEEAVAMAELVEAFMAELDPLARQILELRLSDHRLDEIAALTKRNEKTIRRKLDDLQTRLERVLLSPGEDLPRFKPVHCEPVSRELILSEIQIPVEGKLLDDGGPKQSDPPPSFRSDRDFIIQVHLGSGGTGRVYRARHKSSSQLVALKMLKKASQHNALAVARFLDEARTVATLDHPGIVKVQGIGRTRAGGYFLIQELVHGQHLGLETSGRKVAISEAQRWVAEAAEAIDHAHSYGVIHCDLKPANLLLDAEGHVRVTDFGLATIVTRGAAMRPAIAGTMGYMAPEQLDPSWGPIGPRTDVFGLGAVLFSLLIGEAPFSGKSVTELLQNMFETSPKLSLQSHRLDLTPNLNAICLKCLALAPADRFATAAELAQALRLESAGISDTIPATSSGRRNQSPIDSG